MNEQTMILGADRHLVATTTAALGGTNPPCVAVLTNSGVIPRAGPHRMNVHLARRFAKMGIPSIRFDMSGLGDSRRASGTLPIVAQWIADTRNVMDAAAERFRCSRFFMIGFCSGAEVAYQVALEDERMRAALLWDLYAYPTPEHELRKLAFRLRRAGLAGALEKAVARVRPLLERGRGAAEQASAEGAYADSAEAEVPSTALLREEYARRLQRLADRHVELCIAFCGGEPEWFSHRRQFRDMFRGCAFVDQVAFEFLETCDHLLTRREAQQIFSDATVRWLERRVLPALGASA